ncbi:MAG: gamma-glutamyl-phosphate reductase, partial [Aureliella sp.]
MATAIEPNLKDYCLQTARQARQASRELSVLSTQIKDQWLVDSAAALEQATSEIVEANELDLKAAPGYGLSDAAIDRL